MKEIMDYDTCQKEHLRKIQPDLDKVNSILKVIKARLKTIQQIQKDEETTSIIVTDYYEVTKELLTALLLKNGLKSDNHECLISFFKTNYPKYDYEAYAIHQLKNIRNRINYDGLFVDPSYLTQNELEFIHIIELLQELIATDTSQTT
ncbi:MAG TPA: hypothetical protein VJG90_06405 [Candidatus Nanoarchaeia archaeon]|nr:hypothetical protein [Candidatus Nanoarchaeia archaeon]